MGNEKKETGRKKGLSNALKYFFGIGDAGFVLMSNIETFYFMTFLTDLAQFSAGIAGVIEKYCSRHKELEAEVSKMLLRAGQPEKEPGVMVSTFSWMTTGVKMMTGEDENKQAVKIIMNGCNMGIQSITEALHQCKDASSESISAAKKLIRMEENLRDDVQKYL